MTPDQHPASAASAVRRFLSSLVSLVCQYPTLVLLISFGLCGLSIFAACTRLQYLTSRSDLISPRKDYQQRWQKYLAEFGDDDDIVAVVKGRDHEQMIAALEQIGAGVRQRPELLDRLFYKADLRAIRNRALMLMSLPEIEAIHDNLGGMGPMLKLGPIGWSQLSLGNLLAEAQSRAARIKPGQALSAADAQFLTQLTAVCRSAGEGLREAGAFRNPWGSLINRPPGEKDQLAEPQYFFTEDKEDGCLAFLCVRPRKESGSFTAALRGVEAMRGVLATVKPCYPDLEIGLTGMPVLETDDMAAAQHDTGTASWLAIIGVTLLFLIVYRSIYYPLLTVVTLLVGTAWAMGWLTLTVGHLNILSATFAVMLIGMGDYGVLWVMRYEQARREGLGVRAALLHTTTHVAVGNLTAASTLALAFFAAMFADFQAVAELGWIAGCGVLLCAFACFTVLPALLMLFDKRTTGYFSTPGVVPHPTLQRCNADSEWLPWLARRPRIVLASSVVVIAGMAFGASRVSYDHNLLHLQAQNLESVKWEMTLIEHTAGASWHALSIADNPAEALAMKARFEKLPEVSRVVEVATLVPPDQASKLPMIEKIHQALAYLPPRGETVAHFTPSGDALHKAAVALNARIEPLTGDKQIADLQSALHEFEAGLARLHDKAAADRRLLEFDQSLAGYLVEDLHRLRDVATPARITLDDLPQDLRERHVSPNGKWLLRVFAKDCLWDFPPLEHFTKVIPQVDPLATGKPFGTVEGLRAMKDGLQHAGIYAFFVIVAVLYLDFRNVGHTLFALTPLLLGVLMVLGVMGLFQFALNPANMIAFPLILGVGVDNGVHVLHDYLIRRAEGRASVSFAIGRGVLVKALTTMIGFGTLMISTERGLAGLGFILTLGVGFSMIASLILLPALLTAFGTKPAGDQPIDGESRIHAAAA